MGKNSEIEWTTHSFSGWYGCTKVGPPCDNCYAEAWAKRSGLVQWGAHADRRRSSPTYWKQPLKWAKEANGTRPRVFAHALGDWLDNQVPIVWREEFVDLIRSTPELDWLLLTKRIQNYERLAPWCVAPQNVWLGITCGDQHEYDRDWPILSNIHITSGVRFISYEPALGPLLPNHKHHPNWIICGGESGQNARVMDLKWARDLRDCCAENSISFFFKQTTGKKQIPDDLMVRQFPEVIQ